jgi:hypothetical protein
MCTVALLLTPALWAQDAAAAPADEEIAEEDDPANWVPHAYDEVDVETWEVPIRTYRTKAKAVVAREYMPWSDEARMVYACKTNVFDEGDARVAIVEKVNDFIKENRDRDFARAGNPHTIKPYYHFRIISAANTQHVHSEDPREEITRYTMFVQFYN